MMNPKLNYIFAALGLSVSFHLPASAAVFTVTENFWGTSTTTNSFAWALDQANTNPGADTIDLRLTRAQTDVDRAWVDRRHWNRMSLLNSARSGFFSSDRSIREYAERIWKAETYPVSITCEMD